MNTEQEQRIEQIERWLMLHVPYRSNPNADRARAFGYLRFLLDIVKSEKAAEPNLAEHDKTRFLDRGFAVVENAGHSLRIIDRNEPRHAISIKWNDLPALRELITLALNDAPDDLTAFRWAETLSEGEQSVLLAGSLKRLQGMINNVAVSTTKSI